MLHVSRTRQVFAPGYFHTRALILTLEGGTVFVILSSTLASYGASGTYEYREAPIPSCTGWPTGEATLKAGCEAPQYYPYSMPDCCKGIGHC